MKYRTPGPLPRFFLALLGGVSLFVLMCSAIAIAYSWRYAGRIFPGVSVAGIDVSGLDVKVAEALIEQRIVFPHTGRVVFYYGEEHWIAAPHEVGLALDAQTTALAAYGLGRSGGLVGRVFAQFDAWYDGRDLPPLLLYDERLAQRYLAGIAPDVERPAIDAALHVEGAEVVVTPGQIGRLIDQAATLAPLQAELSNLTDTLLPLVVGETPPVILDVEEQAALARQILSEPLTLSLPNPGEGDPGPWTFQPDELAPMLTIHRVEDEAGARYQVGLDAEGLRAFLDKQTPGLARTAANARFIFNDDTRLLEVIQPAVIGRTLDVDATIQAINEQLVAGQHDIQVMVDITEPDVLDTTTGESLGIRELVASETSFFYGSSAARIQNIETAAARFHGVLIPPFTTFSMADTLGDVSLDTGYAEALIIYGDRTIQGVGGGVCQVSTTLFRTAFFGGYPVVERHSHAYRVGYYEQNAAAQVDSRYAGLDATVFVPVVDFKFTNDTPNWLLMETYTNAAGRSLTWKFYSTSLGRTVEWDTTGLQNVQAPPDPLYQENPDLAAGETNQVDWAVDGADVTISRTVYQDGQVYISDHFTTHYMPWRAVIEYGPGTKLPKFRQPGEGN